jgi:hypothetical protein
MFITANICKCLLKCIDILMRHLDKEFHIQIFSGSELIKNWCHRNCICFRYKELTCTSTVLHSVSPEPFRPQHFA